MEHVVFYPGPDAAPAFHRFASLDEAVRFVEHLRNAEGVSEVSVHALTPVPLAFRTYYKAEIPSVDGVGAPAPAAAEVTPVPVAEVPVADAPVVAVPVAEVPEQPGEVDPAAEAFPAEADADAVASPNGKRSLGFFAH